MKNIAKEINQILAEWDPLDVGKIISSDEYQSYVPRIMKNIESRGTLACCLEDILNNSLEVGYDNNNEEHQKNACDYSRENNKIKRAKSLREEDELAPPSTGHSLSLRPT